MSSLLTDITNLLLGDEAFEMDKICFFLLSVVCACVPFFVQIHYLFVQFFSQTCDCFDDNILEEKYDFIIVGGGTAGSIVARRLAENSKYKVLLLEAGDTPSALLDIPVIGPFLQLSPYDWQHVTVPQANACLAMDNNQSRWPAGKILGGSSRLNNMIYIRGHPSDYDTWAKLSNSHWDFKHVWPFFKKSGAQRGSYMNDSMHHHHSKHGPQFIEDLRWTSSLAPVMLQAAKEMGFSVHDVNSRPDAGFMQVQVTSRNGARFSTDSAFLAPSTEFPNLKVFTNGFVEKILFDSSRRALGVVVSSFMDYRKHQVVASKEVILCAGALGSPKLLMLSGIGPAKHLRKLGIRRIRDLPVGRNLQDHITTGMDLVTVNSPAEVSLYSLLSPKSMVDYFLSGTGVWTSGGAEVVGFINTNNSSDAPDIQITLLPWGASIDGGAVFKNVLNLKQMVWDNYFSYLHGETAISLLPVLLRPRSRGDVHLRSKNHRDPLVIDPQYLTHPMDVQTLIQGIKVVIKIVETEAFQMLGAKINTRPFPGCETFMFGTDEYWECYVRHLTLTSFHPVGTCRMGSETDVNAVVDAKLRVHGVKRLRVIDASVMPTIVSGNINAAVMMIAEKGASMVREQWYGTFGTCHRRDIFLFHN